MSLVRIENRGKNLFNALTMERTGCLNWWAGINTVIVKDATTLQFTGQKNSYNQYQGIFWKIQLQPNTTYTLCFEGTGSSLQYIVETQINRDTSGTRRYASPPTNYKYKFTTDESGVVWFGFASVEPQKAYNIMLLEGDYTSQDVDFEPPRDDYIEFNQELFSYNGVADELHSDGTLIKSWKKETRITITSGAGTVSSSGTGTCILINETDGLPYEGTVSGTSISTSAPDGTYTVIYQLATPEIIDLNYDGELILHPGENNLILPDFAVAAISGARKYLEG